MKKTHLLLLSLCSVSFFANSLGNNTEDNQKDNDTKTSAAEHFFRFSYEKGSEYTHESLKHFAKGFGEGLGKGLAEKILPHKKSLYEHAQDVYMTEEALRAALKGVSESQEFLAMLGTEEEKKEAVTLMLRLARKRIKNGKKADVLIGNKDDAEFSDDLNRINELMLQLQEKIKEQESKNIK